MRTRLFIIATTILGLFALTGAKTYQVDNPRTGDHERRIVALEAALQEASNQQAALRELVGIQPAPIGTIAAFGGVKDSIPNGWKLCNGESLDRSEFKQLYTVLKDFYRKPEGDVRRADDSSFNLPDFRGMFLRGFDDARNLDKGLHGNGEAPTPGEKPRAVGSEQVDSTRLPRYKPIQTDEVSVDVRNGDDSRLAFLGGADTNPANNLVANWNNAFMAQRDNVDQIGVRRGKQVNVPSHHHLIGIDKGSGGDAETRPVNIAINYIIRVK